MTSSFLKKNGVIDKSLHSFHELSPHLLCHLLKNRFVYLYVGIRTVISEFYVKQALSKPFRGLVNASDNL